MPYTIDFSPTQEKQLVDVASKEGLEPTAYIKQIEAGLTQNKGLRLRQPGD